MMKLQRLQTKLQTINPKPKNELRTSWRDGKSSTQRGYGYKWQQYRLKFLQLNPLCIYCERQGLVTEATVMCAELAGDFHLGDSRQLTDKSLLPFDLVS
ncbi:hypothetical protein ACG95P_09730 [Acinetobacter guillouiae]|uniref:hypothetical protein n=1 Tax=Acinetobacter guillouiae TaxID=106649 RepID=UPI003AF8F4C7